MDFSLDSPGAVTVPALQRQLRRGHLRLRFAGGLEARFIAHHRQAAVSQRLALYAAAIVLVAMMPLADAWFLNPPAALVAPTRAVQWGLMIPLCLLGLVCTWRSGWRQFADASGLLAVAGLLGGVLYQRHLGAAMGYEVPAVLVAVILAGGLLAAELRARILVPAALVLTAAFALVELQTFGARPAALYTVYSTIMLMVICAIGACVSEYHARANWLRERLLEQLAMQDPLTGFLNSRAFDPMYRKSFAHAVREARSICVGLIDIDFFRSYNDRYGHAAGDDCLQRVAERIDAQVLRRTDLKARIRGDALVVVWYGHRRDLALQAMEAIRASVQALQLPHEASRVADGVLSVSVGGIWLDAGFDARPDQALRAAEYYLSCAKRDGRNRVRLGDAIDLADSLRVAGRPA